MTVCSWNTNAVMVWAWRLPRPYALGTRTLLWFGHGCSSDRMLLEHERHNGLGMDALIIQRTRTRTSLWFGHGCCSARMLLEHERYYGLGMGATVIVCSSNTHVLMVGAWALWSPCALGTRTLLWFGHGCSGQHMLLEHERYYGLGMGATVTVCSWNIMVWAWMLQ